MADKKKIVVICGPTATGKTSLSIELARKYSGEIISADSIQVYRGLDIGSAKATPAEQAAARHHLIDILDPREEYNVQKFCMLAKDALEDICSRDRLPFIVGGTGLYIESFINDTSFSRQPDVEEIRARLNNRLATVGRERMYEELKRIDPEYALKVHPNNTIRVMRAIEVYQLTGKTMSYHIANSRPAESPYDTLLIGITYSDRQKLYDRINYRIDLMVKAGLLNEARYVYNNRERFTTSANAIGYKEFFPYFEGTSSLDECTEELKKASRHYAKRQLTWFNRMKSINWIYPDTQDLFNTADKLVKEFIDS